MQQAALRFELMAWFMIPTYFTHPIGDKCTKENWKVENSENMSLSYFSSS